MHHFRIITAGSFCDWDFQLSFHARPTTAEIFIWPVRRNQPQDIRGLIPGETLDLIRLFDPQGVQREQREGEYSFSCSFDPLGRAIFHGSYQGYPVVVHIVTRPSAWSRFGGGVVADAYPRMGMHFGPRVTLQGGLPLSSGDVTLSGSTGGPPLTAAAPLFNEVHGLSDRDFIRADELTCKREPPIPPQPKNFWDRLGEDELCLRPQTECQLELRSS